MVPMIDSPTFKDSIRMGIVAGQIAGWSIFGLILAIDANLLTPTMTQPGTFYKMIGMAFGQGPATDAYVGFLLHMITATVIGIVYLLISNSVKKLYITSVFKGLATGTITGVAIWAILFLPLHFGVMQPMLENIVATSDPSSSVYQLASTLVQLSGTIVTGALAMHIVFGGVLGFSGRLATSSGELVERAAE
ncbi:hypothetical protein [Nitrososphaera sp.]|uniref:hypothetical protein n=1 Tax=Nitrososphaera sp. TaxID=1971748 RepID=UPI002ED84DD4